MTPPGKKKKTREPPQEQELTEEEKIQRMKDTLFTASMECLTLDNTGIRDWSPEKAFPLTGGKEPLTLPLREKHKLVHEKQYPWAIKTRHHANAVFFGEDPNRA